MCSILMRDSRLRSLRDATQRRRLHTYEARSRSRSETIKNLKIGQKQAYAKENIQTAERGAIGSFETCTIIDAHVL